MSSTAWAILIVILLVPLSFVGMYFEHRVKWETGRLRPARDCPTCKHVVYAEYCDCPEPSNHFHSVGYGVTFPCDDTRCPEWKMR